MKYCMKSHKGMKRSSNEDCYGVVSGCRLRAFVIADGMGGHCAGEVASSLAVEKAGELIKECMDSLCAREVPRILKSVISRINAAVYERSLTDHNCFGMGTTIIVALFYDKMLYGGHVGDSRAYVINGGEIKQITKDHSYVEELLRDGYISEDEAKNHPKRNVITRAIGTMPHVDADIFQYEPEKGDIFLLCTDGLTNMLDDEYIKGEVLGKRDLCKACEGLIDAANKRGGHDNITVILVKP